MDNVGQNDREVFLDLLMQNQMRIYAYILSLVRNYHDADDLLQETVQTMYQKYQDSLPINDFVAWGIQIAKFKILNYRKKMSNSHVSYDERLFESCLALLDEESKDYDGRMDRLGQCLKRLRPRAKELVKLRYYQDLKPRQISLLLGLSVANIYKAMSRIHGQLLECMNSQ